MADTEKITINISVVDLGQIELLVSEGFYSSRTDFIRTAIRNQMERHTGELKEITKRKTFVIGVLELDRKSLEKHREKGEMLDVNVVGLFQIKEDVSVNLVLTTINKVNVHGVIRAAKKIKDALQDMIS